MTATATAPAATEAPAVEVGSVFSASWGYDQTNVDFYKVVSITPSGKSVRVQKVRTALVSQGGPYGDKVVAGEPVEGAPVTLHRLLPGSHSWGPSIKVRSWGVWAYLWDGKPEHQTDPVFGH